ncbi:MAG: DNA replication and repair protein RecF [Flavobacteriales bacterium]|nr:DNA replication and repair protein RecF [Flavobacteriales bacterium]
MFLKNISYQQFKSHGSGILELQSGVNCFTGKNGVGKTNILDAIYCLLNGKSYFQTTDNLCIQRGTTWFMLKGTLGSAGGEVNLMVSYQTGKRKSIKIDEQPVGKLAEYFGTYPCVVIAPDDVGIIHGESDQRRRFFDYLISVVDKTYLANLAAYNKTILMRNKQLKLFLENQSFDPLLLSVYEKQLIKYGKPIYETRKMVTEDFEKYFHETYRWLSHSNEIPVFQYQSKLDELGFEDGFKNNLNKDRALGRTTFGIHRDDWNFELNHLPLKKTGSQGQIKTFLISLKIAMFRFIQQKRALSPLLLLDDIFEKIDHERMKKLVGIIAENPSGQIIITDTSRKRIEEYFDGNEKVKFFEL